MDWTGGCLCGAVRYRATAAPLRAVSCHCAMCRRASGAAFLTFVHFPKEAFAWTEGAPTRYRSSANAERVSDRDRANRCEYFRPTDQAREAGDGRGDALSDLENLFKKD